MGRALNRITAESDAFGGAERDAFIAQRYEEIERQWANP
ncbi:hypothetical protein L490_5323 [Bordetella bronchiseptica 00-P-2796]|uniref:Uncharacterized protein n=1 Tax=Bordetella bronchiseptica 00-P-2796 TaxID=1331199 RepID=A0ABR4RJ39_BORBO|nr:hypothetical protein L490_5323 [Bordetella bronchiseptica 00-P-2796]